jgi:hypothetical protein
MRSIVTAVCLLSVFAAACGGSVEGAPEEQAAAVELSLPDASPPCGIHQVVEWPTYLGDQGATYTIPAGDSGLWEVCTRVDAGPFYLCAPPAVSSSPTR